jgi:hypothetical protein
VNKETNLWHREEKLTYLGKSNGVAMGKYCCERNVLN